MRLDGSEPRGKFRLRKYLITFVAAIVSGMMLGLSLPPVGFGWLGWIALVPVFACCLGRGFLVGFLSGLICAATPAFIWANGVIPSRFAIGGDPAWIYGGFLLFGALLAVVCGLLGESQALGPRRLIFLSTLAVILEFSLVLILPASLAITQARNPGALLVASVAGIWGVSFLVWLANLSLASWVRSPSRRALPIVLLVMCLALGLVPGRRSGTGGPLVSVVQTESTDLRLLSTLSGKESDLAVWPELSGIEATRHGDSSELQRLSQAVTPFVTSFEDDASPKPHNTAALFAEGKESARYWKRKPFAGEITVHAPGTRAVVADWRFRTGLNICFDSCYPSVIRETAMLDPWLIAVPTQDPVTPLGVIQSIHAAYSPFRSAELGIGIARADQSADSMIVGPDGSVLAELGAGDGSISARVPPPHVTLYRRFGDWFLWLCGAIALGILGERKFNGGQAHKRNVPTQVPEAV